MFGKWRDRDLRTGFFLGLLASTSGSAQVERKLTLTTRHESAGVYAAGAGRSTRNLKARCCRPQRRHTGRDRRSTAARRKVASCCLDACVIQVAATTQKVVGELRGGQKLAIFGLELEQRKVVPAQPSRMSAQHTTLYRKLGHKQRAFSHSGVSPER